MYKQNNFCGKFTRSLKISIENTLRRNPKVLGEKYNYNFPYYLTQYSQGTAHWREKISLKWQYITVIYMKIQRFKVIYTCKFSYSKH